MLQELLQPTVLEEDLVIRITFLIIAHNLSPAKYRYFELDKHLLKSIENLHKRHSFFGRWLSDDPKSIEDLQTKLDEWYFSKLLGYGDSYQTKELNINQFISDAYISSIQDPDLAVLLYIYIRSLVHCQPEKYSGLKKHIDSLIALSRKKVRSYGYLLTHLILYDIQFGCAPITQQTLNAITELSQLCQTSLTLDIENADLIAEIIICYKLCRMAIPQDLLYYINQIQSTRTYHEKVVLLLANF